MNSINFRTMRSLAHEYSNSLNPERIHYLITISKVYLFKTLLHFRFQLQLIPQLQSEPRPLDIIAPNPFFQIANLNTTVILLRTFIEVFLNNLVC